MKDRDPVTGLYPFALAASEPSCDIKTIVYLLKLHPDHGLDSFAKDVSKDGCSSDDDDDDDDGSNGGKREKKRRKVNG